MLVERSVVDSAISRQINKIIFDKEKSISICSTANERFDIPTGEVMDFLGGRIPVEEANELQLFILVYSFDEVNKTNKVSDWYTESEITEFKKQRYQSDKIKFPIKIDCVQVAPDQWIGKCDARFLMRLRNSQLINYNENAQRALKRRIKGGLETYTIDINNKAVDQIVDLYGSGNYISNTITLNIPENADVSMSYNKEDKQLVINSISSFDIADGYHRFMALSRIYQRNKDFNYEMELRIIQFDDDKVKQFIFQEDQKTKMRKVYSDSYNVLDVANMITERINTSARSDLAGQISRNEGKINYGEFAKCVQYFYKTKKTTASERMRFVGVVRDELISKLNAVMEGCSEYAASSRLSFMDLMIIFTFITSTNDTDEIIKNINKAIENKGKLNTRGFSNKVPRRGLVKEIREVIS